MSNAYSELELVTESDVEQKFIYKLLTTARPLGLGLTDSDFRTKPDIRKFKIDKGTKEKLYHPDYVVIISGLPTLIIEAKAPNDDLYEALRQARLYATEINASFPRKINPVNKIIATDGKIICAGYWDTDTPHIEFIIEDIEPSNIKFSEFIDFASRPVLERYVNTIQNDLKKGARFFKPTHMLGGDTIRNESVGENSFGSNISLEYKYLFNPETEIQRELIVKNAYVDSKKRESHVSPIDKIIRASVPPSIADSTEIKDTKKPVEIVECLSAHNKLRHEICLLIGSAGSGKSTFSDYLRLVALPSDISRATKWYNINLNSAPVSKDLIYDWLLDRIIEEIKYKECDAIDFDGIDFLKQIFGQELKAFEKGPASLYPKDSPKYIDLLFDKLTSLQSDRGAMLKALINSFYVDRNKLMIIVLDNCDKRNREEQLLMFEVASWLKSNFTCMIFLPLRESTYDQYCNEPPLDTVVKDLVFRIDPPLLNKVLYARLNYALREISSDASSFYYSLSNGMRVSCKREEIGIYLKCILTSLFQNRLFKRLITGLAGRNIRKGLEIVLDFCKSGHIAENEILKIRSSNGEYQLPFALIANILIRGNKKYYQDNENSLIKNLFHSEKTDPLPDPFIRIAILNWLKNKYKEYGPNKTKGYHQVEALLKSLQVYGHSKNRILEELESLIQGNCIVSESLTNEISTEDLISIAPGGIVHLELLHNITYLSSVAEDTNFRDTAVCKGIANKIIDRNNKDLSNKIISLDCSKLLIDYLIDYKNNFFISAETILNDEAQENLLNLEQCKEYINQTIENDHPYVKTKKMMDDYPPGANVEAQITSIQPYGFFVEFGLNGTGLVHKSKFVDIGFDLLKEFEVGEWIKVEIIEYSIEHNRFNLKLV